MQSMVRLKTREMGGGRPLQEYLARLFKQVTQFSPGAVHRCVVCSWECPSSPLSVVTFVVTFVVTATVTPPPLLAHPRVGGGIARRMCLQRRRRKSAGVRVLASALHRAMPAPPSYDTAEHDGTISSAPHLSSLTQYHHHHHRTIIITCLVIVSLRCLNGLLQAL